MASFRKKAAEIRIAYLKHPTCRRRKGGSKVEVEARDERQMVAVTTMIEGSEEGAVRLLKPVAIGLQHIVAAEYLALQPTETPKGEHLVDATPTAAEEIGAGDGAAGGCRGRNIAESLGMEGAHLAVIRRGIAVAHHHNARTKAALLKTVADVAHGFYRRTAQGVGTLAVAARGKVEHNDVERVAIRKAPAAKQRTSGRTLRGIGQGNAETGMADEGECRRLPRYGDIHSTDIVTGSDHITVAQTGKTGAVKKGVQGTVTLNFAQTDDVDGGKTTGIENHTCQMSALGSEALGTPFAGAVGQEIGIEMQTVGINVEEILDIVRHQAEGIARTVANLSAGHPSLGGKTQGEDGEKRQEQVAERHGMEMGSTN